MKLVHILFAVCMFTSSCEIVLTLQLTGNLHIAQLLFIVMIFFALGRMVQRGTILWPIGGAALAIWAASQILFIPFSGNMVIGTEFVVLMLMTITGYFAVLQIYGDTDYLTSLMKLYLLSYIAMGVFGLVQFFGPLLGFPSLFVTQWFIHGRLARINGFTYEPSYYATYLLMGWTTLVELRSSRAALVSNKRWKYATIILSAALVLSSSKTGILVMMVELLALSAVSMWHGSRRFVGYLKQGRIIFPVPAWRTVWQTALVLGIIVGSLDFTFRHIDPLTFLNGSGVANTPSHSADTRENQLQETLSVVYEHPFVGRSLGGVSSAIAANKGVRVRTVDETKLYLGFPVYVDILAASGVIAFIPFAMFLWQMSFGSCSLAKKHWPTEQAKWLRALGRATVIVYVALSFDQNMFRIYVWVHLAVVSVIAYRVKYPLAERAQAELPIPLPAGLHSLQQPG